MDKLKRKLLWKEKKEEAWRNSKPDILSRDVVKMRWECSRSDINFVAEIDGIKLSLSRYEVGNPESYGGKMLLARHFLDKKKWHDHVKECFGEGVFLEIFNSLNKSYEEYKSRT